MTSKITAGECISFTDLIFSKARVLCYSSAGTPYYRTVRFGMPRIPPLVLNSVFFLYKTEEDAKAGSEVGGTGFIVALPTVVPGYSFTYFVTNWHNVLRDGCSVVRLDTVGGTPDIFTFEPSEWHFSTKYDIAVIHDSRIVPNFHRVAVVGKGLFLTKELKEQEKMGPGEDVFMVGRFVDYQGLKHNVPAVRFGNISMDPVPMEQPNGARADSYCIDMHSRSGFSGSPVFLYRTLGFNLDYSAPMSGSHNNLWLLGIHWGQFPEKWELNSRGKLRYTDRESHSSLPLGERDIEGLSGMTCVLPAWSILEVLNMPELKVMRDTENAKLVAELGDIPVAEGTATEGDTAREGDAVLSKMLNTPKPKD